MDTYTDYPKKFWNPVVPNTLPPLPDNQELERRVAELEEWMRKAKAYDDATGQKDCELDEKKQALQKIAEELGIEIQLPA